MANDNDKTESPKWRLSLLTWIRRRDFLKMLGGGSLAKWLGLAPPARLTKELIGGQVPGVFASISLLPEGRHPGIPGFTPDKEFLIVPNQDSDNVSIISFRELNVVHTIQLRKKSTPWMARVTPDGRFAFVSHSRFNDENMAMSSEVSVIDLSSRTVAAEIRVGVGANGIEMDQAGRLAYVANMRSNDISVIDIASRTVISTIPVGSHPVFARLSPDEKFLVVTNFADASLSVIDTGSLAVVNTIQIGNSKLIEPNPEFGPGDTTDVGITPNNIAYATNWRSNEIVAVDLTSGSIIKSLNPLKNPFGITISPALGLVIAGSDVNNLMAIIDFKTNEVLEVLPVDGTVYPKGRAGEIFYWANDPKNHRINVLCPNTGDFLASRNHVSKHL